MNLDNQLVVVESIKWGGIVKEDVEDFRVTKTPRGN